MEMPSGSGKLSRAPKLRQTAVWRRTWLAGAAAIVALSLMTGCKQQASQAAPSNQQLTSSIQAKLNGDPGLAGQKIQVSVSNGVATLSGTVANAAARALAGDDSGTVTGVKTVVNNLTVQPAEQAAATTPQQTTPAPAPAPARTTRHSYSRHTAASGYAPRQYAARRSRPHPNTAPPPSQQAQMIPPSHPTPMPSTAHTMQASSSAPMQTAMTSSKPKPVIKTVTIPAGTTIPIIMTTSLDSQTAQPNQTFHASIASDVVVHNRVALPMGAPVLGEVVNAQKAAHFRGRALLAIDLTQVTVYGKKIGLITDTYSKEGQARGGNTAKKAGGGALLGALIGALAGGGRGALVGAMAGGGAGAGVNAVTRGKEVQIPSEARVDFHLQAPITLKVQIPPPSNQQQSDMPVLQP